MEALKLLFASDIGLLSVFTIVFAGGFVVFVYQYARKHMEEDAKNAGK